MGPPNLHFLDVFMVKNLVFRWPKPLIVLWVLLGTSWISTGSAGSTGSWLKMTWRPRKPALPTWGRRVYGFQGIFFGEGAMKTMEINFGLTRWWFQRYFKWWWLTMVQFAEGRLGRNFVGLPSLKFNIFAPENGLWEDFLVSFWDGLFSGAMLVSGRVNNYFKLPSQ